MKQWKKPEILAEFQVTDILTPELLSDWKEAWSEWVNTWSRNI